MPGLTSLTLVCLLAVGLAVLLGVVLWRWPRLSGPGIRRIAVRVAALCTLQAMALGLMFVIINRANGFYSSWSDLFGRYTGGGTMHSLRLGVVPSTAPVSVLASRSVMVPGRSQPAGTLQAVRIRGQTSGLTFTGNIYLPPGYPGSPRIGGPYPVIVAITGPGSGAGSPSAASRLAEDAASQIVAGRLQPVVMVMLPAGPGADLGCLDVPGGPQATMFFTQDLPYAIGIGYRTSPEPTGWGLLGDSTGGYCALQLALTNAATFSAAAVPPGRYKSPPGQLAWASSSQVRIQENLSWLMLHQPMQPVSVLFGSPAKGSGGGLIGGGALALLSLARSPMHAASMTLPAGPAAFGPELDWLGQRLNAGGAVREGLE